MDALREKARLLNLESYGVLDSESHPAFENLAFLGAKIGGAPVCLIGFIDECRHWIKSGFGSPMKVGPRSESFCTHAIEDTLPLIVEDTALDARFLHHPLVTGAPFIRFYAGFPIISREGFAIGTLCLFDFQARGLSVSQSDQLILLAEQAAHLTELHRNQFSPQGSIQELNSVRKLTALGKMTAGILHEINTPLTVIYGHATLLANSSLSAEAGILQGVGAILETVKRVNRIVSGLRALSENRTEEPAESLAVNEVIRQTLPFFHSRCKAQGVNLSIHYASEEALVSCRAVQISQVLLNLVNNALDSLEHCSSKWLSIEVSESDAFFEIRVSDGGPPIKPVIAAQIFTPFFTTKEKSKGSGLGLAISQELMAANHGVLALHSTRAYPSFVFTLPKSFS